jgi:hypothetical protein
MRYRKQDQNGDYVFGNGQGDFFKDSPEAVAQAVKTRLLLWKEEWFLDIDEGTPYLQGVIGKHSEETRDTVIRTRILNTEGMRSILSYERTIDPETRKLSLSVSIDTIYGNTTIQVAA